MITVEDSVLWSRMRMSPGGKQALSNALAIEETIFGVSKIIGNDTQARSHVMYHVAIRDLETLQTALDRAVRQAGEGHTDTTGDV